MRLGIAQNVPPDPALEPVLLPSRAPAVHASSSTLIPTTSAQVENRSGAAAALPNQVETTSQFSTCAFQFSTGRSRYRCLRWQEVEKAATVERCVATGVEKALLVVENMGEHVER